MNFRDTKGYSLRPEAWEGPGALLDNHGLREDLSEIAGVLDRVLPGSPAAERTRALLERVEAVRRELLTEWAHLGPTLAYVGWEIENGMPEEAIPARLARSGITGST